MKTSQVIKAVIAAGIYAQRWECNGSKNDFFCHALDHASKAGIITREEALEGRNIISDELQALNGGNYAHTLNGPLCKTNKVYCRYIARYGFNSKCCFKIRLAWFEQLAIKLESEGN